jgi:TyrR family helix-turn-helix protein
MPILENEGLAPGAVLALVLEKREPVTVTNQRENGKVHLTTGSPFFDKKGSIFKVITNVRDVTEINVLKQKIEQVEGLSQHYESQLRSLRLKYAGSEKMIIKSEKMKNILETVVGMAKFDFTILITGESGTGKELIAETIHNNSSREKQPFIKVNCGAIPENLLESELFGYDYGAFTGAKKEGKTGYFQLAHGGTIFLDEIGDMPFNLQVKLLRVLQNREIIRVGGEKPISIDVRIITGTNRNLMELIEKKQFRQDLYYRLNVVPIHVPALRERKEEIPALTAHFLKNFNKKHKQNRKISAEVTDYFLAYDWPGNVRELENLIERLLVTTAADTIYREHLPQYLIQNKIDTARVFVSGIIPLHDAIESVEKQIIEKAYKKYRTTRQMAKELKVDASTIVRKAARYGISKSSYPVQ